MKAKRLFMIANNLPVEVNIKKGKIKIVPTIGGFASGLEQFYKSHDMKWIGRVGIDKEDVTIEEKNKIKNLLIKEKCYPVYLDNETKENYLEGFCNNTIWPLFHYFTQNIIYSKDYWKAYKKANEVFADTVVQYLENDDILWIHDYHLLLLPKLIHDRFSNVSIGFFLHIPFPSFEIFRLLPWRVELLEGLLGADLIGFHTYDYDRHFMSCVRRLLGYDTVFNRIRLEERIVKVDAFPRGVDYKLFSKTANLLKLVEKKNESIINKELNNYFLKGDNKKIILSIDRLDYSKGISERLRAYDLFLKTYPEYREKVSLLLFVVPSRENVAKYQDLKKNLDELVGRINGKYGVINWMPIWYFYRTLHFEEMVDLYRLADIALITPIRDGMNLIAKEFIASKTDKKGVLILSEMAGASKEMSESILVNPNNWGEVAEAIVLALNMPVDEQRERNSILQKRLNNYDEEKWANDFINSLAGVKKLQETNLTRRITEKIIQELISSYKNAEHRILFLDYDGTLAAFNKDPQMAKPDKKLFIILNKLLAPKNNTVVIISGRDKETLSRWFEKLDKLAFIAEHGVWTREPDSEWKMTEQIDKLWMEIIHPILEYYVDRTPRSFVEHKNYSLVWHYRNSDPDLGTQRSWELKDDLKNLVTNLNLEIMDGDKVIEIKNSGVNKGRAALNKIGDNNFDFILAIGDDWTDEYTFDALPEKAFTIKVGSKATKAKYYVEDTPDVRNVLSKLID